MPRHGCSLVLEISHDYTTELLINTSQTIRQTTLTLVSSSSPALISTEMNETGTTVAATAFLPLTSEQAPRSHALRNTPRHLLHSCNSFCEVWACVSMTYYRTSPNEGSSDLYCPLLLLGRLQQEAANLDNAAARSVLPLIRRLLLRRSARTLSTQRRDYSCGLLPARTTTDGFFGRNLSSTTTRTSSNRTRQQRLMTSITSRV